MRFRVLVKLMNRSVFALACFGVTSVGWSQTIQITSVVDNLGQPRIAPGGGASIYGSWPSGSKSSFAVTIGNMPAFLNFAANDGKLNRGFQIGLQVPTELPPGDTNVVVSFNGVAGPPFPVTVKAVDPVVTPDPFLAFLHTSGVSVQPATPAAPGETITTFMTGLGATNPTVPSGTQPSTFTPTTSRVSVSVGGTDAQVIFAGRYASNPPFVALDYQVSFIVPSNAPPGPNPVVIAIAGVNSNTQTLFTGTAPLSGQPTIKGVVSGGNFLTSTPIGPSSFVSIFGTGFGSTDNLSAFPSTQVNGISVLFNGKPAPIFSLIASAGQINVLTPSDMAAPGETVTPVAVVVQNQNGPSKASNITTAPSGPSMFSVPDPSSASRHNVAALLANTAWYVVPASQAQALGLASCTGLAVTSRCGQPAKRGDFVQLYATGLGLATPDGDANGAPLATGQVAPADGNPVYATVARPVVTVGGQAAQVGFSGLAPGYAGLYQVNFQIPQNAPTGESVVITIAMPGSTTDSATLAIQ